VPGTLGAWDILRTTATPPSTPLKAAVDVLCFTVACWVERIDVLEVALAA